MMIEMNMRHIDHQYSYFSERLTPLAHLKIPEAMLSKSDEVVKAGTYTKTGT
jgi:hypothetical protein